MPIIDGIRSLVEGPWGGVLLDVPWIVLFAVIAATSRRRRRSRATEAGSAPVEGATDSSIDAGQRVRAAVRLAGQEPRSGAAGSSGLGSISSRTEPEGIAPTAAPVRVAVTAPAGPPTRSDPAVNGSGPIHVEAAASVDPENAALHALGEARRTLANGHVGPAAELLREAVRVASRAQLPAVHAAARLELAEIACIEGDLTTACEHWQIARGIFHETRAMPERDRISERMRSHRCPTDWVLTNF